jgi:hypothetical protein
MSIRDLVNAGPPTDGDKAFIAGKVAELIERSGIDPEDIGRITKVNLWQQGFKDADGEGQVQDLVGIQLAPTWADGPQWPVVQPAAPTVVRYPAKPRRPVQGNVTAILPDPQFGYRRFPDGTLDPFHDEAALDVALQIAQAAGATTVVWLGDGADLPEWSSKFQVAPEFVETTQPTLDVFHLYLARSRSLVGEAGRVVLLEGNHDDRLSQAIIRNAKSAMRLRPAMTTPETWPVLSMQNLLRLDDIGVEYVGGYPAGKVKVAAGNDRTPPLYAIHGERLDVAKVAKAERVSFVQGHAHHKQDRYETYDLDGEPLVVNAWSPGCLCRIDGAVPSQKGGTDAHGRPVRRIEAWQQGVGIVTELEDGSWSKENVLIDRGRAIFRGQLITNRLSEG